MIMKRLAHVLLTVAGPLILGACQEKLEWTVDIVAGNPESLADGPSVVKPSFEEIMPLDATSPHPQGGDCRGDYFFQFVKDNTAVRVYDLNSKTLVQTIKITKSLKGFVANCHCNSVNFGTEYYDPEDVFPLIYVSTGYASGGYTGSMVYRITLDDGTFSITLVQTIKFPVDDSSWTEFIPGEEYGYLCYTSERVIYKVPMPKLKDGDVIISRDDAVDTYQFTPQPEWMSTSRNQDRMLYQGKLLVISGVPRAEASVFMVLNLETRERERIIDFTDIGLTTESESLFLWRGDICVAFVDKIVRLIDFVDPF